MYVKNDNHQELTKFLTRNESRLVQSAFFIKLKEEHENDPKSLMLASKKIGGDDFVIIIGGHGIERVRERSMLSPTMLMETILELLEKHPLVGAAIKENAIFMDDDGAVVPYSESENTATVILYEGCPVILVVEAGFSFIHVKTVLQRKETVFVQKDNQVIKVLKDGTFISCIGEIPEICQR
jgi:hypothetical protein